MILAPPLLPFPLLLIARRTLNVLFPKEFPWVGFCDKLFSSSARSFFNETKRLGSLFDSFIKRLVGITLKFIKKFGECLFLDDSFAHFFNFRKSFCQITLHFQFLLIFF